MSAANRRLLAWRAVSVVALLLILAAVTWRRDAVPKPVELILPPYPAPAVMQQMLTTKDLPSVAGGNWVPMQDGPPDTALFNGTGRMRNEVRLMTVIGAWQRIWISADSRALFMVRVLEMRNQQLAKQQADSGCSPETTLAVPGADTAGYLARTDAYASGCAAAVRGRTAIVVQTDTEQKAAAETVRRLLAEVTPSQVSRVSVAPDLALPPWNEGTMVTALNSSLMGAGLGVPLLFGLVTLVFDRASWRRLRSRFARRKEPRVFAIDALASVRLANGFAMVLLRAALYVWVIRLAEELRLTTLPSLAAGASAIAMVLVVEWLVRRRRPTRWRPAVFTGRSRLLAVFGALGTAAIGCIGIYLIVTGSRIWAFGIAPGDSDFTATRFGLFVCLVGGGFLILALVPFLLVRRLGMRRLRHESEKDGRRPILLLRSFADDRRTVRARRLDRASILERLCLRRFERFEEVVASALAVHGPVLALSQVGESLPPPLGAVRRTFAMDDWKDRVGELIADAQVICVTVGRSESLLWEIRQIRAAGALQRTIFVLPPVGQREQRRRLAVLGYALGLDWDSLDRTRPRWDVLAVTLPFGDPLVVTGRAPDDVSYELAVDIASAAITNAPGPRDLQEATNQYLAFAAGLQRFTRLTDGRPARPAPRAEIYPPGKAPAFRPLWKRPLAPWVLSATFTTTFLFLFGHSASGTVNMEVGGSVTSLVQDTESDSVYAVFGTHELHRVDIGDQQTTLTAKIADSVSELVVRGDHAFYTSTRTGRVGRLDLSTGRTTWVRSVGVGVRGIALAGDRLVVVSPSLGRVDSLALDTGKVAATRPLAGTPFAIAPVGKRVIVSLALSSRMVELDPVTLAVLSDRQAPDQPRDLVAQGREIWVRSLTDHSLQQLRPAGSKIPAKKVLLSRQAARMSSNGGWVAIHGMEWVSVISPIGRTRRIPITNPTINSLLVQRDGAVVLGYSSGQITRLS